MIRPDGSAVDAGIEDYLSAVAAGVVGPPRWRSDVLAELRDGLSEAADAYRSTGASPGEAAARATAQFGAPSLVAAGFAAVGAANLARRVARLVLASGPVAALCWVAAMAASGIAPWNAGLVWPWRVLPVVGVVVALAVNAALLALAMTGRVAHRWGAARPRLAPAAAVVATGACAVADVVMLAATGVWLIASAVPVAWPVVVVAGGFSATRGLVAGWAARRCRAARARVA